MSLFAIFKVILKIDCSAWQHEPDENDNRKGVNYLSWVFSSLASWLLLPSFSCFCYLFSWTRNVRERREEWKKGRRKCIYCMDLYFHLSLHFSRLPWVWAGHAWASEQTYTLDLTRFNLWSQLKQSSSTTLCRAWHSSKPYSCHQNTGSANSRWERDQKFK